MASENQKTYIVDLVVIKTKEFKEVKELLFSSGIVSTDSETIKNALTIAEITDVMDDLQASKFIDALIATPTPARSNTYSANRVEKTVAALDDIKETINRWDFS